MEPVSKDFRIYGDNLYLRPVTTDDIEMMLKWRNSPYVVNNYFYRVPISYDDQLRWIKNKVMTGEVFQFIVCLNDNTPVGCVYLQHYEEDTGTMESGVFMSEDAPKGQGIGTEAVSLLNYDFAFKHLSLKRTVARVIASNIGSIKLHEKAGFKKISTGTDTVIPTGEKVDSVEFELQNTK